jgi:D-3-phosphoglycerate dehydrogenase
MITDGLDETGQSILRAAAIVEDRAGIAPADLLDTVHGYDALIVGGRTKVSREVFEAGSRLKVVGQTSADLASIDLDEAKKHGQSW